MEDADERWLNRCMELAEQSLALGEVPVGCVIVCDGTELVSAHNEVNQTKNATNHAEIVAIKRFEEKGLTIASDCEVFVTSEPCIMCAAALRLAGFYKCAYACANERFGGCGSVLQLAGDTQVGLGPALVARHLHCAHPLAVRTIHLLKQFYAGENPNAPPDKRKRKIAP